jgi:hypothetical protein
MHFDFVLDRGHPHLGRGASGMHQVIRGYSESQSEGYSAHSNRVSHVSGQVRKAAGRCLRSKVWSLARSVSLLSLLDLITHSLCTCTSPSPRLARQLS